jgi:hypothetical protein
VEDFINSSSTTALSSVPVLFLVQVVTTALCSNPPQVIGGTPITDSCTTVTVGQTFAFRLIALNSCGSSVTIVDIPTLSFLGVEESNVVQYNSTTFYKDITWTPTSAQIGYQVMCAMAIDG